MPKTPAQDGRSLELTAQPRSLRDELKRRPIAEEGLSVDADELGRQFLAGATEQDNYESEDDEREELSATGASPTDDALVSPSFDVDEGVWDETVDLTLQEQGRDAIHREPTDETHIRDRRTGKRTLDLSGDSVLEGSLLDDEAEQGETRSPEVNTEDKPRRVTRAKQPR